MRVHCKKCDNKAFNSIQKLRQHQWTQHWDAAMGKRIKTKTVALRPPEISVNGIVHEMTAAQLLEKLKNQRNFMHDVVTLVEGLIK